MMTKAETLQDKLTKFHRAFGHPINESFPAPNHKIHALKKLRRSINNSFNQAVDAITNLEYGPSIDFDKLKRVLLVILKSY